MAKERIMLDTDALIDLYRKKNREIFLKALERYHIYVSFITLYEFLFGEVYIGRKLEDTKRGLERVVSIIPLDQEILGRMIEIDVELTRRGIQLEFEDLAIGATAIVNDLPLVSANISHFKRLTGYGLKLMSLDEFKAKLME